MATRLLDLELSNGGPLPDVPLRYERIRLLARLHGIPLGFVDVENSRGTLDPPELSATALRNLERQAWAVTLTQRLTGADAENGERPPVTVVVAATGMSGGVERCLAAIAGQRYRAEEVISLDADRGGRVAAWNRGLSAARTPIVAFTDDRSVPDPDWLEAVAAAFHPGIDAVTGLVVPAELETRAQEGFEDDFGGARKGFRPALYSRRTGHIPYRPGKYGAACNMAFRREALERLGGFDAAVEAGEGDVGAEADALQRLIEAGAAVAYRPEAIVRRVHVRSVRALRRQLYADARACSASLTAAFLRARGRERLRVATAYWAWLWRRQASPFVRRVFRRGWPPRRCLLAGLLGGLAGPAVYGASRVFRSARTPDPPGHA